MKYSSAQEIRFLDVLRGPCITEKGERAKVTLQQFLLEVDPAASTTTIKQAVEWLFDVQVEKVNTVNVKGKTKLFKQIKGKRKNWKKAYISLKSGQMIDWTRLSKVD